MFIKKVELRRFKQFDSSEILLKEKLSLIVGANNSGKSSLLQALGTWQFCKNILEIEKTRISWTSGNKKQGFGVGLIDFTPISIPSLNHLWSNLNSQKKDEPDGYTLKIKVFWDDAQGSEKYLEIGLSLANDRLFIRNTSSNLIETDLFDDKKEPIVGAVPEIAYLPPFAGITDRELRYTPAMRTRLIGQGLSGAVLRNTIYDLYKSNQEERIILKGNKSKISDSDLQQLRSNNPWEILQRTMQDIFSTQLKVNSYNEKYHSYLKVETAKGEYVKEKLTKIFKKYKSYNYRDLMVEGSGFLQWLSVYALSLSPDYTIILLDEPDAHLHAFLQTYLVSNLEEVAQKFDKQILLATHSPELIRSHSNEKILKIENRHGHYLQDDSDKIKLLAGIGTIHSPKMHSLMKNKRLLIVEGESDERFLKKIALKLDIEWPKNIVVWIWTGKAKERKQLYLQLKKEIPELKAISIRDRDDETDTSTNKSIIDYSYKIKDDNSFLPLKWRRRHIENYFLHVKAIATCSQKTEEKIEAFFKEKHSLFIPENFTDSDVTLTIRDAHGKEIINVGEDSINHNFNITRDDILECMTKDMICDDLVKFMEYLKEMCSEK